MKLYYVYQNGRCLAQCTSWESYQAALRLLVGPPLAVTRDFLVYYGGAVHDQ